MGQREKAVATLYGTLPASDMNTPTLVKNVRRFLVGFK